MEYCKLLKNAIDSKIWVIKIGSAMLTDHGKTIDKKQIDSWAQQIIELKKADKQVILVSSGAIAAGIQKLGWDKRPGELSKQQAAAAVGQMTLTRVYEEVFAKYKIQTAQVLLTHDDAADRKRYLNIKSTITTLLDNNILPIVNENDTTSFDEIKFGDNDNLGALVANLVHAGIYIILTDQDGLYDSDPRLNKSANIIKFDFANNNKLDSFIGKSKSSLGSGGMLTKIQAARKAMNSGTATIIMHGQKKGIIKLLSEDLIGTALFADTKVRAKKQWLAGQLKTKGEIIIDAGAEYALLNKGKSLLSVGIIDTKGSFARGEIVSIKNERGVILAKGICNYNNNDIKKIKGIASDNIEKTLGYVIEKYIVHRDNLALI